MVKNIESIVRNFCCENHLDIKLSYDMPAGYESAFGTYDVTVNTLYLNIVRLHGAQKHEVLFYLFHELRHAMQYLCPMHFNEQIRESIAYVILYNGHCFKLEDSQWQACVLTGDEDYFSRAYMSLPYEIDANTFAYEKAKDVCGDHPGLQELLDFWVPKDRLHYEEYKELFRRIDAKLQANAARK